MKISIVIPVYNSSQILPTLLKNINSQLAEFSEKLEVVLVNDFSLDDSWKEIKKLKENYNFIKGINLKKNYGQHSAIFCGLRKSNGDKIVCMDDDMQHDPKYILDMIKQLNNFDVCYVKYEKREHNYIKILVSKLNNIVSSFLMNKSLKIYTSSFKCFNKNIKNQIIENNENFVFLDYWIFKYTSKITFINVKHNRRLSGKTNYGLKELLTLWSKMIFLIDFKNKGLRSLLVKIIKAFFILFLKDYVGYKKDNTIEISEMI